MESWMPGLTRAFSGLWQATVAHLPQVVGAVLLLLTGWFVARLFRFLAFRLINRLGRWGAIGQELKASGVGEVGPRIIAALVFWVVFVFFVAAAGQIAGLAVVTGGLGRLVAYLPSALSGVLVILAGVVIGNLARTATVGAGRTARISSAEVLGELVRGTVFAVAGVIALEQFGINSTVLVVALGLMLGGAIGGLALAFGLGSRGAVSNLIAARHLRQVYRSGQTIQVGDVAGRIVEISSSEVVLDTGEGQARVPASLLQQVTVHLRDQEG